MITIAAKNETLAGNCTTGGILTVATARAYWPGAVANISATGLSGVTVILAEIVDTTHIRTIIHPSECITSDGTGAHYNNGAPDLSAYTTALGARIDVPQQTIPDMPGGGIVPKLPTYYTT